MGKRKGFLYGEFYYQEVSKILKIPKILQTERSDHKTFTK